MAAARSGVRQGTSKAKARVADGLALLGRPGPTKAHLIASKDPFLGFHLSPPHSHRMEKQRAGRLPRWEHSYQFHSEGYSGLPLGMEYVVTSIPAYRSGF